MMNLFNTYILPAFTIVACGLIHHPLLVEGMVIEQRTSGDRKLLGSRLTTEEVLRTKCRGLRYLTEVAIENGHLGILGKRLDETNINGQQQEGFPSTSSTTTSSSPVTPGAEGNHVKPAIDTNNINNIEEEIDICKSFFFHLQDPQTKVIEHNNDDSYFPDSHLYPLAIRTIEDLLDAYDSVHLSDRSYDIVTNNCAGIVLDMMCSLRIEVSSELIGWVSDVLLHDNPVIYTAMMQSSPNIGLLDVGSSGLKISNGRMNSIMSRRLVEYSTDMYHCPHFDEEKKISSSTADDGFGGHGPFFAVVCLVCMIGGVLFAILFSRM